MNNYPTYKLGEICETTSGGTPNRKNDAYYGGSIPWVKSGELGKGIIYDTEEKITEDAVKESSAKVFPKGTLLIALYGATIGKLGFLGVPAATNQAVCGIFANEKIDLQFLSYYLFHKRNDLIAQGTGGAQPNISQTILKNLPIPLPPLPTQHLIVSRIESLFAELDKAVQHLRTAQQQIKTYRQAVLNHWLNNDDGKWEMVKIESVADVVSGYAFKSNLFKDLGKYQIIRIGNIRPGIIRIKESPVYYDEIPSGTCSKVLLKKKDVVITLTGTRKKRDYGYTAMVTQENLLLNQRLAYFRFDNKQYDPAFFLYYSWTDSFKDDFFSYETGNVGQGNVGIKAITKTEIPLPPLAEQQRIVAEIESRLSQAEAVEASIEKALQQSEALRQSILKKAFEGELV